MAISWPANVPFAPLVGSFKLVEPWRPPEVTDLDEGPSRSRPSSSMVIAKVQFTIRMVPAEYAIFKAWARDDLVFGTMAFEMQVWTGASLELKTCHVVGATYQSDAGDGNATDVSLVLDVEDY